MYLSWYINSWHLSQLLFIQLTYFYCSIHNHIRKRVPSIFSTSFCFLNRKNPKSRHFTSIIIGLEMIYHLNPSNYGLCSLKSTFHQILLKTKICMHYWTRAVLGSNPKNWIIFYLISSSLYSKFKPVQFSNNPRKSPIFLFLLYLYKHPSFLNLYNRRVNPTYFLQLYFISTFWNDYLSRRSTDIGISSLSFLLYLLRF